MSDDNVDPVIPDHDAMPPGEDQSSTRPKSRKSNKQTLICIGGLVVAMGWCGYILMGPSSSDEVTMPSSGAAVDTEIEAGGSGGGQGQERASVLSEIDDREAVRDRIQNGKSAIQFGEVDDVADEADEPETDEAERPSVFGDISPREEVSDKTPRQMKTDYPISGNPGRPAASMGGETSEKLAYELDLMQTRAEQGSEHGEMNYTQASRGSSQGSNQLPITPELQEKLYGRSGDSAESRGPRWKAGSLALPGDLATAYMSNRISSDQPSGIVAIDILDGKLKGAKAIGKSTFEGDRLLINFDRIVYKGEVLSDVKAYAVDPHTLDASLQSGIDRRLMTRYGVPILMGLAGIGVDYAAQRDNTTVYETNLTTGEQVQRNVSQSQGFGQYALQEGSDTVKRPFERIADKAAEVQPEVWAEPGVIGLLFDSRVPSGG